MSGKIKLIILVVLMIVSFAVAFFATRKFSSKPAEKKPDELAKSERPEGAMLGDDKGLVAYEDKQVNDIIKTLRAKIDQYNQKLMDLEKREKEIKKSQEDLRKQADDLADLQARLTAPLNNLKAKVDELQKTRIIIKQDQKDNLTQLAAVYTKMAATEASQILEAMCKNRQEEDAARIMYYVSRQSDRQAGKIWDAFTNKDLAARLNKMMERISDETKESSEGGT